MEIITETKTIGFKIERTIPYEDIKRLVWKEYTTPCAAKGFAAQDIVRAYNVSHAEAKEMVEIVTRDMELEW